MIFTEIIHADYEKVSGVNTTLRQPLQMPRSICNIYLHTAVIEFLCLYRCLLYVAMTMQI